MSVSNKTSAPLCLRPFATALLDANAIKRLETKYAMLDDIDSNEQMQIYDDEKQKCVEKYGDLVEVANNFDLIFSVHIMQVYADIIQSNEEAEMQNADLTEILQQTKTEHEKMQLQFDRMEHKYAAANARVKTCEAEMSQMTSSYKVVIRELKDMENMQWNVIVVQVYICIILSMLVAIGSCMLVNVGCEQ